LYTIVVISESKQNPTGVLNH